MYITEGSERMKFTVSKIDTQTRVSWDIRSLRGPCLLHLKCRKLTQAKDQHDTGRTRSAVLNFQHSTGLPLPEVCSPEDKPSFVISETFYAAQYMYDRVCTELELN